MAPSKQAVGHPRHANKAQVAQFFDVSMPTVDAWIRRGCPALERGSLARPWVFDLAAVSEWQYSGRQAGTVIDPENLDPVQRRAWYEGEVKKRALAEFCATLIPAVDVARTLGAADACIAEALDALPERLIAQGIRPEVAQHVRVALAETLGTMRERLAPLTGAAGA